MEAETEAHFSPSFALFCGECSPNEDEIEQEEKNVGAGQC